MLPQERELVPIAALKLDPAVDNVKEAATAKAERVLPFKNRPFAVFEQVLDDADHFGGGDSLSNMLRIFSFPATDSLAT